MKAIKRKNIIWGAIAGLDTLTGGLLLAFGGGSLGARTQILLVGVVITSAVASASWLWGHTKLKTAQLIAENPLLLFRTAAISEMADELAQPIKIENTEVIVSYFGILLDAKIIKFNQDGIRLRAVEIGGNFISFTYGTEKRTQNIRLLRPAVNQEELEKIVERFRYETGITPTLTTQKLDRKIAFYEK